MVKHFILLGCMVLSFQALKAQWPLFRVYHVSGKVACQHAGQSTQVSPHKSSYLYQGDKLVLDKDADITLFDRDTNYITIHAKGVYATEMIAKMQRVHIRDNITIRYFELLWEDLFKPVGNNSALDKETMANSKGGVARGTIAMLAPSDFYQTSMDAQWFRWHRDANAKSYRLSLNDPDGKLYFDKTIMDTQVNLLLKNKFEYGKAYKWELESLKSDGQFEEIGNGELDLIDEKEIISALPQTLRDTLSGIAYDLQLCELFEDNGCIKKSYSLYQELFKKYPNDKALKKIYDGFLERNYLKKGN